MAVLLVGCRAAPIALPAGVLAADPWFVAGIRGVSYESEHYRLCTTVRDPAFIGRFIRLMEAAHAQYALLIPADTPIHTGPLEIDLLATDRDFHAFTAVVAGAEAPAYERVGTGGYTLGERFVCRYGDEQALFSVAAHEGFHQFAARHCRTRLPPTIEEGLATTFENVAVRGVDVQFDRSSNPRRQNALGRALRNGTLIPLDMLIQLNAGDVAGRGELSETYYGQCWALARLLETAECKAGFEKLLSSTLAANGDPRGAYRPAAVRPLLESTVAPDWERFKALYGLIITKQTVSRR